MAVQQPLHFHLVGGGVTEEERVEEAEVGDVRHRKRGARVGEVASQSSVRCVRSGQLRPKRANEEAFGEREEAARPALFTRVVLPPPR